MGWNGCIFFKKVRFNTFRLEVYPFVSFSKAWSMIFSAAQLCCGALLFCLNPSDSLRSSAPLVGEPLAKPEILHGLPRPPLLGEVAMRQH